MELPYSSIRHFPAGTYREQVETWIGREELAAMNIVHQAWYMFSHLDYGKWKETERKFARWMDEKPQPQPTNRVNEMIALLWRVPFWLLMLMGRQGDD